MALWYDCGNGWVKSRGLARCNLGVDAYLCCPGPSLAEVDTSALKGPGRMVFAVTTAYPAVRPDVWVGTDVPECYDRRVWAEPFIKVARGNYGGRRCQGRPLREFPNVFFADIENAPFCEILDRRAHDVRFVWNRNTFTTALHLVLWMGGRRIFLVGCDFGGKRDYHDDRELSEDQRAANQHLMANLVNDLRGLTPAAKERGIGIISCTPDSPINEFLPFVPLVKALVLSESQAPDRQAPILHATDAERCQWRGDPPEERGVLVGFDAACEWLVPWWFDNFHKHNTLPVAFADFGMSEAMRGWCGDRGRMVDVTDVPVARACFRKPFAILRAPFKEVLSLEPDCEVRGSVRPLLESCRGSGVALAPAAKGRSVAAEATDGWFAMCTPDTTMWDAGIIAVNHGHSFVTDWAAEALAREQEYKGDNEALARVIAQGGYEVSRMPPSLAFNRYRGPDNGSAVFHWTGTRGKVILKERLDAEPTDAGPTLATTHPVQWASQPSEDLGVMVPVCRGQEDLVPWWWHAYARRNQWPVVFADFGMDSETRRWCEARGRITPHGAPNGIDGWFRKPFALLQSPFRRTVWCDLDCEVRENVARVASVGGNRLAIGRDWSYPVRLRERLSFGGPYWCGGCLVVTQGDPLVLEWAEAVLEKHKAFRGDQEILSALLGEKPSDAVAEIPLEILRSRQEGEADGVVIVHWSGPGGKGAIRRAWSAIQAGVCRDMRSAFHRDWTHVKPISDRGVVAGFDEGQEWLLDWWWSNYSTHNDLPVLFVDLGMSAAAREWCAERGLLAKAPAADCYGWFKKPLALLESPFRQAIWLDADCEVRGGLTQLFEFCADDGIGMTVDRGTPRSFRDAMPPEALIYNSGVIAFNHGDPVIPQWASMTMALRSDRPGDARYGQPGDQETLALTLCRYVQGRVCDIPMDLVRLRLSDGDGPALVMHWTGPDGKQRIRDAMDRSPVYEAAG
ncbi:MAG: hypothetical protein AMK73_01655 [Planctomycetes bacterium SM23_32]|nr:MAG: hypothetical protein AMK73_01655 [Planctomycetes bacterium SM23_32]